MSSTEQTKLLKEPGGVLALLTLVNVNARLAKSSGFSRTSANKVAPCNVSVTFQFHTKTLTSQPIIYHSNVPVESGNVTSKRL